MKNELIKKRLNEINAVIPFSSLLDRDTKEAKNIAKYYRLNRLAYKLINSKQGFVHMGISRNGVFKEKDFLEHANLVTSYINSTNAKKVLELAAGKAATTKYLAAKHSDILFTGLDLPNGQLNTSSSSKSNLTLIEGDYHDLSRFDENSYDIIYIIEALCHARNKKTVIHEVRRVLKPGGVFIVFDGYIGKDESAMSSIEKLVSELTYSSMMVTKEGHSYRKLLNDIRSSSFVIVREENLSQFVLPTMQRFEKKAMKYFQHPLLARLLNSFVPIEVTGNAVAAYLMPLSVKEGLHEYWVTVAQKK